METERDYMVSIAVEHDDGIVIKPTDIETIGFFATEDGANAFAADLVNEGHRTLDEASGGNGGEQRQRMRAIDKLFKALHDFEKHGPGATEHWVPGDEVDDDALAANVIDAAFRLRTDSMLSAANEMAQRPYPTP